MPARNSNDSHPAFLRRLLSRTGIGRKPDTVLASMGCETLRRTARNFFSKYPIFSISKAKRSRVHFPCAGTLAAKSEVEPSSCAWALRYFLSSTTSCGVSTLYHSPWNSNSIAIILQVPLRVIVSTLRVPVKPIQRQVYSTSVPCFKVRHVMLCPPTICRGSRAEHRWSVRRDCFSSCTPQVDLLYTEP